MPAVTIREVAAAAGVSLSTVSLALNSPARVSEATRKRVLEAVDRLGFVPKAEAVARARQGAGRVGVIGPFSTYSAARRRLAGVLRSAAGQSIDVVVFDQESSATSTAPLLASLPRTGRLDGLIITSLPLDESVVRAVQHLRLPTVLLDRSHPGLDSVQCDNVYGGRLAAEHLLSLGHRDFGYIGEGQTSNRYVSPAQQRLTGLTDRLADAGIMPTPTMSRTVRHDIHQAARAASSMLESSRRRPTAVFASDDYLAAGVIKAAARLGLNVPEDVSVVGYDDGELSEAMGLTTIRQGLQESGDMAYDLLRALIRNDSSPRHVLLEPSLVVRSSSGRSPRATDQFHTQPIS